MTAQKASRNVSTTLERRRSRIAPADAATGAFPHGDRLPFQLRVFLEHGATTNVSLAVQMEDCQHKGKRWMSNPESQDPSYIPTRRSGHAVIQSFNAENQESTLITVRGLDRSPSH